jgi:mRNA-degrading endonuclease toxin of MazEF toxin-antitoxin module
MKRGEVYRYPRFDRYFLVVSTQHLTDAGTVIVVEVAEQAPEGTRGMLTVWLDEEDVPMSVLCWRVNYMQAERLGPERVHTLSDRAMAHVEMALRTAMEL